MKMTEEEIANAKKILSETNLKKLGFKRDWGGDNIFYGTEYHYKDCPQIVLGNFRGIRYIAFEASTHFVNKDVIKTEGIDPCKKYYILDTVNKSDWVHIDIHSNEELISVCEKIRNSIIIAGIKKGIKELNKRKNI